MRRSANLGAAGLRIRRRRSCGPRSDQQCEAKVTRTKDGTHRDEVTRRAFVAGASNAVIGCGLLTAACSSSAGSATAAGPPLGPTSANRTVAPTQTPTPAVTPSPAATPNAAQAPKPTVNGGVPLGRTSVVPVGGGTVFAAQKVVVTQPQAGTYIGLSAICTHQGCLVAHVDGGTINCPCHGSRYHLDGTVARGPASRSLTPRHITVVDGDVELG
jgi:Rieske Fe-S protein